MKTNLRELIDKFDADGGASLSASGAWEDLAEYIVLLEQSHRRMAIWLGLAVEEAEMEPSECTINLNVVTRDGSENLVEHLNMAMDMSTAVTLGANPFLLMSEGAADGDV